MREYIQFLYVALGSLAEGLSRIVALKVSTQIADEQFEQIDIIHYEVENKLIRLIESLENKRDTGTWISNFSEGLADYTPNP